MFGYGYRPDGAYATHIIPTGEEEEEDRGLDARLADEAYVRSWREQSLSHAALIDDGDDERLLQLAANVRPPPPPNGPGADPTAAAAGGVHPVARLCAARGMAYDAVSNPHRAVPFLRTALAIDARCVEALDYVVDRRLLAPDEEREWVCGLDFGEGALGGAGLSWLRDSYVEKIIILFSHRSLLFYPLAPLVMIFYLEQRSPMHNIQLRSFWRAIVPRLDTVDRRTNL